MKKYVALLRGINVGGNKKVEMSRLKSCFESMGYMNIRTYINSGNVLFESENDDFSHIEKTLEETFGFAIQTLFRSVENIEKLAKEIPSEWTNDDLQKTDVIFLWKEYDSEKSIELIETNNNVDTLIYIEGALIWNLRREHYSKSGMNTFIGTPIYKNMTARNVNTVRKLAELMK